MMGVLVMEEILNNLFEKYVENAMAFIRGTTIHDPDTGIDLPPNERFLKRVETLAGCRGFARSSFRQHIAIQYARYKLNHQACDVTCFPLLETALRRKIIDETHDAIRLSQYSQQYSQPHPEEPAEEVSLDDLKKDLANTVKDGICKIHFTGEGGFWLGN